MAEVARQSIENVSHGRGGAGNIGTDTVQYTAGDIHREGLEGDHGDGAYSAGRGGAGNIGSPGLKPTKRSDKEVVPEVALRQSEDGIVHTGRGGEGNTATVAHDGEGELIGEQRKGDKGKKVDVMHPEGLADKLKHKLFGHKSKTSTSNSTTTPTPAT